MSHPDMTIDDKDVGEHVELMSAALDGRTASVKALIRHGVDVNARTHEGRTALMFAIINMHPATIQELLKLGADVNAQSVAGFTPLFLAVCSGDARIVQALLDKGADIGKTLTSGQTALAHAAEHGFNDIVELLKRSMNGSKEVKSQTVPESRSLKNVVTVSSRDSFFSMDMLAGKILDMFASFNKETLDLHELFEAGGNDPDARTAVLDMIERLVKDGLLEERGNDFYALTRAGRANVSLEHKD